MGIAGKLTRADLTSSTPADSPLYPLPPYEYPGADLVVVEFETDAEAAARLLPETAVLGDTPTAGLVFANYPASTLGPYREVLAYLKATYPGSKVAANEQVQYAVRFYVTTDAAMAAGREQAGIPKKIGAIQFGVPEGSKLEAGLALSGSLERPEGTPIVSGSWQLAAPIQLPPTSTFEYLALRLVPSPIRGAAPSLCELVETRWVMDVSEAWALRPAGATAPLAFGPASAADALAGLPVVKPTMLALIRGNMRVDFSPPGAIVAF